MSIIRTDYSYDGTKTWSSEFTEEDKEAFYSLQYWNMHFCFVLKQEAEYKTIRQNFVDKLGINKVLKLEAEFIKSKDYTEMLTNHGVPNSYMNRNEPINH